MGKNKTVSSTHRLNIAKQAWGSTRKIYLNAAINKKVRIILRNAIIRSTLTYALQTHEQTPREIHKLEQFMFKCIRQIVEPYWYKPGKHIARNSTYKKYNIPTIKTWLEKLAITHHLRQTINTWNIHTEQQQMTIKNERKWIKKWTEHKQMHDTQETRTKKQKQELGKHLYMQNTTIKTKEYIYKKVFTQNKEIPDKQNLTKQEQEAIGILFLQIQEGEQEKDKQEEKHCPTCNMWFRTTKQMNKHRASNKTCKISWQLSKPDLYKCRIKKCNQTFHTQKQLQQHKQQHKHAKHVPLYHMNTDQKIDRRKMIYQGVALPREKAIQGKMKFCKIKKKWQCLQCAKTNNIQDKANMIQHIIKTHKEK